MWSSRRPCKAPWTLTTICCDLVPWECQEDWIYELLKDQGLALDLEEIWRLDYVMGDHHRSSTRVLWSNLVHKRRPQKQLWRGGNCKVRRRIPQRTLAVKHSIRPCREIAQKCKCRVHSKYVSFFIIDYIMRPRWNYFTRVFATNVEMPEHGAQKTENFLRGRQLLPQMHIKLQLMEARR